MWSSLVVLTILTVGCQGQAVVHCQPGDEACAKCQDKCENIALSHLPECCEVFSACCNTYSKACSQCSANAAVDARFPEYCCASFTDCCDMVPGLEVLTGSAAKQGAKTKPKQNRKTKQPRQHEVDEPHPEPEAEPEPQSDDSTHHKQQPHLSVSDAQPAPKPGRPSVSATPTPSTRGRNRGASQNDNLSPIPSLSAAVVDAATTRPVQTRSRSRQSGGRRTKPNGGGQKQSMDTAATSINRRGRVTSRGRIVQ